MDPIIQALVMRAMQGDNGNGGLQQELGAYDAMGGPEGFKQHVGLGTLDQRGQLARQGTQDQMGLLQQQMAQAQALSHPNPTNYGTVGGNVASGIGNALGAFFGGRRMADLGGQQKALLGRGQAAQSGLLDQADAGRLAAGNARYQAMRNFLAKQQQPTSPDVQDPAQQGGPWAGGFGTPYLPFGG